MQAFRGKQHSRQPQNRRAHRGQAVIESIASIILFSILLALVMSVTVYLYFQQAMVTAAREGARMASLNADFASDEETASAEIEQYVADRVEDLTGQDLLANGDVEVTGPEGAQTGERTITVLVTYNLDNPLAVAGFINTLGGDGSAFETFPVRASATMRYEE